MSALYPLTKTNLFDYVKDSDKDFLQNNGFCKEFTLIRADFTKMFSDVKSLDHYKTISYFYEVESYLVIADILRNQIIGFGPDVDKFAHNICLSLFNSNIYFFEYKHSSEIYKSGIIQIEGRYFMSYGFEDLFNRFNYAYDLYMEIKSIKYSDVENYNSYIENYLRRKMSKKFDFDVNDKKIFWYHLPDFIF
jgi:hypothetical protein